MGRSSPLSLVFGGIVEELDFLSESLAVDTKNFGGTRLVATRTFKNVTDVLRLDFGERSVDAHSPVDREAHVRRQIGNVDTGTLPHNDEALDEVLQLAHVARPRIAFQDLEGTVGEFRGMLAGVVILVAPTTDSFVAQDSSVGGWLPLVFTSTDRTASCPPWRAFGSTCSSLSSTGPNARTPGERERGA